MTTTDTPATNRPRTRERSLKDEITSLRAERDAIPQSFGHLDRRHDLFEEIDVLYARLEARDRKCKT